MVPKDDRGGAGGGVAGENEADDRDCIGTREASDGRIDDRASVAGALDTGDMPCKFKGDDMAMGLEEGAPSSGEGAPTVLDPGAAPPSGCSNALEVMRRKLGS